MMEWLNDRYTYVTGHSTPAGQFHRRIPRLFLVKGDTADSKLNRHALDSELTKGMRADLLSQQASLLIFMPLVRVRGGGLSVESVPSLNVTRPTLTTSALSRMPCSRQPLRPEEALLVRVGSYLEQIHEQIRTRSRVGQSIQPIEPAAPPVLPQSGTR